MKRFLSLLWLLLAVSSFGQAISLQGKATLQGNASLSVAVTPPASLNQFFADNFESSHEDTSWSADVGTGVSYAYNTAPAPLDGSFSCSTATASSGARYCSGDCVTPDSKFGGTHTEVDMYFLFNAASTPGGNNKIISFADNGGNDKIIIYHKSDGTLAVYSGGVGNGTVSTLTGGTTYKIWMHAKSDGTGTIGFASVGGSRPTSGNNYATTSGGTVWTGTPVMRLYLNTDFAIRVIWDHIRISDGPALYGDNPT